MAGAKINETRQFDVAAKQGCYFGDQRSIAGNFGLYWMGVRMTNQTNALPVVAWEVSGMGAISLYQQFPKWAAVAPAYECVELTRTSVAAEAIAQRDAELSDLREYKTWYDEAMCASNEHGWAGMSAAQVINAQETELTALRARQAELDRRAEYVNLAVSDYAEQLPAGFKARISQYGAYAAPVPAPSQVAAEVVQALFSALEGMLEYFPEGHSDGECFSVEAARTALSGYRATQSESKPSGDSVQVKRSEYMQLRQAASKLAEGGCPAAMDIEGYAKSMECGTCTSCVMHALLATSQGEA